VLITRTDGWFGVNQKEKNLTGSKNEQSDQEENNIMPEKKGIEAFLVSASRKRQKGSDEAKT